MEKSGSWRASGGNDSAVLPKPRKKPEKLVEQSIFKKRQYDGAVQLSGAKAFSLDWKLLTQRQEFCSCGTHFGAIEFSIV